MKLLYFRIRTYSSLYNLLFLKNIQAPLKSMLSLILALALLYSHRTHAPEKYLKHRFHIVDEHFLKVLLLLV